MAWYMYLGAASSGLFVASSVVAGVRHFIKREVQSEMQPNDGKSFRDHVDNQFATLQNHLRSQDVHLAAQDDRFNGLDSRLNGVDNRLARLENEYLAPREF